MENILTKALCYIAIIILGYTLRILGFFKEENFYIISRIVLKITLPAAIITNFANKKIEISMLFISFLGLCFGVLYIIVAFLLNIKSKKEKLAFEILNLPGYNIGNFALPFTQNFLGSVGVMITSLFDAGNALICMGGSYSIASIIQGNKALSIKKFFRTLFQSVPFDVYLIMIIISLLQLPLPKEIITFTNIIASSNTFLSMLVIGIGFKLPKQRQQIFMTIRILLVRYIIAIFLAILCFFVLPFQLEYRKALTILVLSPIASACPVFTANMNGNVGLSSTINSLSIIISIFFIIVTITIFGYML